MPRAMTLNVRVGGELGDHVAWNVGDEGLYENVSEYVRDLIRRDRQRMADEHLQALRAELEAASAEPDESAESIDGPAFLVRLKQRRA